MINADMDSRFREKICSGMHGVVDILYGGRPLRHAGHPPVEDRAPAEVALPGTRFLTLSQGDVAYREMGDGAETVLFIHCFVGRLDNWRFVMPLLADHARTVAFDLWGFGASARPPMLSPADWSRQVIEVMDALGIARATLVGHSLGGEIALACAAHHPERVCGVVLIGSNGEVVPRDYFLLKHLPLLGYALKRFTRRPCEAIPRIHQCYPPRFPVSNALLHFYLDPLRVCGTKAAFTHLARNYPDGSLRHNLPRVHCPALLIWGDHDRITPPHHAHRLVRRLHHAKLILLPGIAHLPHEECPKVVAALLKRFMGEFSINGR